MTTNTRSLEEQRAEFARSPFLAMPIAGTIAWTVIGIGGALLPIGLAAWLLFFATGSIFGLGLLVARFTGEDLTGKGRPSNTFDSLFMLSLTMAWLAFGIAIPFFLVDPTSLPLSVGILSGLMWVPFSWIIQAPIALFHGIARTVLIVAAHYLFPDHRFVAIPAVIVVLYLVVIAGLAKRKRDV